MPQNRKLSKSVVFTALFAALTAACAFVSIPVPGTPIPIVLQNMMVVLSSLLLGPALGTASTLVFIIAGVLGLPVFSGGTGGIAKIMGPTGGFIIGYAFSSLTAGLIAGRPRIGEGRQIVRTVIATLCGFIIMYIPGVLHFMRSLDKTFVQTMALCVTPYIPGDIIKAVICILLSVPLRRVAAMFIFQNSDNAGGGSGKKPSKEGSSEK